MAFAEELSTFLVDFGVSGVAGSSSAKVIFDGPDESVLGERATSKDYSIVYINGSLGAIGYGSQVVVSGTPGSKFDGTYKVIVVNNVEDGQFQRARLELP